VVGRRGGSGSQSPGWGDAGISAPSGRLHDADVRPIRKGRLGKPVEFGYKVQIVDNADGIILDHTVELGNPVNAPQLIPAIERTTRRTGLPPQAVTADRDYGFAWVENVLHQLGVYTVSIWRMKPAGSPRQEFARGRALRHKIQMAHLNRRPDQPPQTQPRLGPHPLARLNGARTWRAHGVFVHNLVRINHPGR
jgi:IS5 family transposase